jgi:hypothetical protein
MSDDLWTLHGVEPQFRVRAAIEASRLGLSLGEYLSDILRQINGDAAGVDDAQKQLNGWRDAVAEHVAASAAESMAEVRSALAAADARQSERFAHSEQAQARAADQLRQLHAALAADFARETHEQQSALQEAREEFSAAVADLRDRQFETLARVERFEPALATAASETATLRETLERRLEWAAAEARVSLAKAQATWQEAHLRAEQARRAFNAELERLEACTLAALQKQAGDRADDNAAQQAALAALEARLVSLERRSPVAKQRGA